VLLSLRGCPRNGCFRNRSGTGRSELKRPIADLFDAAGLRDARSHDLRRTFGMHCRRRGLRRRHDCRTARPLAPRVTQRHYIRRPDAALVAAADRVSRRITKALGEPDEAAEVVPLRRKITEPAGIGRPANKRGHRTALPVALSASATGAQWH